MVYVAPKYGYCPDCHQPVHNQGAHAEACRGPMEWTGRYQCDKCLLTYVVGGGCWCGGRRRPFYRPKRVLGAPEAQSSWKPPVVSQPAAADRSAKPPRSASGAPSTRRTGGRT